MPNPKHFETPVAWYEDSSKDWEIVNKFCGKFFSCKIDHSPFDVVAW